MAGPAGGHAERVRATCLDLPGVSERPSHGAPTFFVGGRSFVTCWPDGHHAERFPQAWCAAPPGVQQELTETEPERFFRPPYVGGRGWIGVRLEAVTSARELERICAEAYLTVAPPRLARLLESLPPPAGQPR